MLNVNLLTQRDSRWASKLLGFSQTTIGGYGCLLTALTALSGRNDVGQANDIFRGLGNFPASQKAPFQGNLVVWFNVPNAFTNLKFIYRYNYYDNNKVSEYVYNKRIPVVVEVDAAPIGSPRTSHFVLYLGDRKLFDPWTGQIRPTSDFPIQKGFALYEWVNQGNLDSQKIAKVKEILAQGISDSDRVSKIREVVV